jgi:hypothetical protein
MILTRARTGVIYDFLSPPLILITPFISFVKHNDYSYAAPEFWIFVAGLAVIGLLCGIAIALGGTWLRVLGTAGLLTLFVDLQFEWFDSLPHISVPAFGSGILLFCWLVREHLSRIVVPVFATMLASTVAVSAFEGTASPISGRTQAGVKPTTANRLPTIVHIILDEHIGIEGIPADVKHGPETKDLLKSFYQSYGFRLFGRAYSRYGSTRDSIPNMLNYASRPLNRAWVDGDRNVIMRTNRYFEDMHKAGYEIYAFQINAVDVCSQSARIVALCYTEDQTGIKEIENLKLPPSSKAMLIYQIYTKLSEIDDAFQYLDTLARDFAERNGWNWPGWWPKGVGMGSIRATHTMSLLTEEVAHSRPGQLFFAHLLFPHHPFIYDANCKARDPADWELLAYDPKPLPPNTTQSRRQRYALYLEQVQCLSKRLAKMFGRWEEAGIFDRARIIIQGDHGSRIYLRRPEAPNADEMVISDYADAFSTLLAVSAPGYEPGYDLHWVAIQELLPQLAFKDGLGLAQEQPARPTPSTGSPPYVFLESNGPGPMVKQPLPSFGDAALVVNQRGAQLEPGSEFSWPRLPRGDEARSRPRHRRSGRNPDSSGYWRHRKGPVLRGRPSNSPLGQGGSLPAGMPARASVRPVRAHICPITSFPRSSTASPARSGRSSGMAQRPRLGILMSLLPVLAMFNPRSGAGTGMREGLLGVRYCLPDHLAAMSAAEGEAAKTAESGHRRP